MDAFFVTVSLLSRPEWRDLPVIVAHGGDNSQIASANYAARKFGIKNGCVREYNLIYAQDSRYGQHVPCARI